LKALLSSADEDSRVPALDPRIADEFRERGASLASSLSNEAERDEARQEYAGTLTGS
jgi:hypothetical protein